MDLEFFFLSAMLFVGGCICFALGLICYLIHLHKERASLSTSLEEKCHQISQELSQIRCALHHIKLQLIRNNIEREERPPPYTE